ncbi:FAD-binding oxidoreductase [Dactylosporangium sp. CA-092794]|uniref:FAD-binding oxidoreductase n=1 Tax=Dactylosporangium sp. CA-092794 TaxID=3239929 RepID=UPI003D8FA42F
MTVEWSTDPEVLDAHRLDRSGWDPGGRPSAVAFAASVADVQEVLRAAHERRTPVVVRGAGTGLSGGAAAPAGSVVLDVRRLDRIREISPADGVAVVEPGVITADLDRAAAAHGLRYAPDPASLEISTIGGNIATNAGGLRCAKYGVTRDAVLGLDVVLADGTLLHTGGRTLKNVTGYDLTGLFVGSEGTLGVIVGATLRLRPVPVATATLAAYFGTVEDAAGAVTRIAEAGVVPAVAELLDAATLAALGDRRGGAFLLVQTDGAAAEAEADAVEKLLAEAGGAVTRAAGPAEADALVATRRRALPALEALGRPLIEDIAVPRSRLAEAVRRIAAIAADTGVAIHTVAHAADGNLHPIIVVDRSAPELPPQAWEAASRVFRLALDLGGTLTGEHGVGALKRRWLGDELGPRSHELQQGLRRLFDPHGILNPGKAV